MDKQAIYDYLQERHINYQLTEHTAAHSMTTLSELGLPHPEAMAKNIFVRDDRHECFYLITLRGDKRVKLNKFKRLYGTRTLTFASEEELERILGLKAGSVSPLGLLHDPTHQVELYLDSEYAAEGALIGIHPCDNTATLCLPVRSLVELLRAEGKGIHFVDAAQLW
ncbi:YbaK/EbsC family protein [Porphyromonas sp.]